MSFALPLILMRAAQKRIQGFVRHTPILRAPTPATDLPPQVIFKLENTQVTGSFKPRGVFNNLLQLEPATRVKGVVAASGGNHGVALAYAAQHIGIPAVVYLPATATEDRVARVGRYRARIEKVGASWDEAHRAAVAYAAEQGIAYIHPFDARPTLSGQATLGLELLADVPEMDYVLIAIGGGGLIAGMAAAIKAIKPSVKIIGVEPTGAASMKAAVDTGRLVELAQVRTIADTLSPRSVSERTLALTQQFVDDIVLVSDDAMIEAMRWLWVNTNQLVEPSGAAVVAAILEGKVNVSRYHHPVALLCGGNVSADSVWPIYEAAAAKKRGS